MSDDDRDQIYVHVEVASPDDVRIFYEIPASVAARVRDVAPDAPFVEALVQVLARTDALNADNERLARTVLNIVQEPPR